MLFSEHVESGQWYTVEFDQIKSWWFDDSPQDTLDHFNYATQTAWGDLYTVIAHDAKHVTKKGITSVDYVVCFEVRELGTIIPPTIGEFMSAICAAWTNQAGMVGKVVYRGLYKQHTPDASPVIDTDWWYDTVGGGDGDGLSWLQIGLLMGGGLLFFAVLLKLFRE